MGTPLADWDRILEASRIAFAVVPGPDAIDDVAAAWDDLYSYYTRVAARRGGGLTSQLARALDGHTAAQVAHVTGTVSNGFGAMLPILAVAITELAQRPNVIASCTRGERTWASVAGELLRTRTIFPISLPRIALADTWLSGRHITRARPCCRPSSPRRTTGRPHPASRSEQARTTAPGPRSPASGSASHSRRSSGRSPVHGLRVTWTGRRERCQSPGR